MKMNIFEGARRTKLLLQAAWLIGCAVYAWSSTPTVFLTYSTEGPSAPFQKVKECSSDAALEFPNARPLANGRTVSVELCFEATKFPNGEILIPYREEN